MLGQSTQTSWHWRQSIEGLRDQEITLLGEPNFKLRDIEYKKMCQVSRDNRLLVCGKAKSLPERHQKETYCIEAVRTCEEFLPYGSLCIHMMEFLIHVYVSTSVHVCGVSVYVCVCGCRGQRSMSATLFHYSQPIPLKQGLPLNMELTVSMMLSAAHC